MFAASQMTGTAGSVAQAMHSTTWSWPLSSALNSHVLMAQILTVWSLEQLANRLPSELILTILTHSRCPVSVLTQYLQTKYMPM